MQTRNGSVGSNRSYRAELDIGLASFVATAVSNGSVDGLWPFEANTLEKTGDITSAHAVL